MVVPLIIIIVNIDGSYITMVEFSILLLCKARKRFAYGILFFQSDPRYFFFSNVIIIKAVKSERSPGILRMKNDYKKSRVGS